MRYGLFLLILISGNAAFAQNVGIGTNNPHPSAQLEISSNNKGLLPPRMSFDERNAIASPAAGLVIWCTDCLPKGELQVFNGSEWTNLTGGPAAVNYAQLPSVTIGTQIWSLKNLDVSTYRNGDPIPQVKDPTQWANLTTGAWCYYNNDSSNGMKYGKLYNWYAVNDTRGLAPQGWRVPSENDLNILAKFLDPIADTSCGVCDQSSLAGGFIKEAGLSNWISPNTGATNSSGLTILPCGGRYYDGSFISAGNYGFIWSFDSSNILEAWNRFLNFSTSYLHKGRDGKKSGFSVRLIRD